MPQKPASKAVPNLPLRQARLERWWSQAEVADKLSDVAKERYVHTSQVSRWESGVLRPSTLYQQQLCALFGKTREELGFLAAAPGASSAFLFDPLIPQRLRPLIGRDELLQRLKQHLSSEDSPAFTTLFGLPGVGKTALAVELAHDPATQQHFSDGVLWVSLGPHPILREVLSRWARLLGIRGTESRAWRTEDAWTTGIRAAIGTRRMLLVIDDAWEIEAALACALGGPFCAHLLTTRTATVATYFGNDQAVSVHELTDEEGVALLAQFAPQAVQAELEEIRAVVREVGGLPLALRLIGSYLSAHTYHHQTRRLREALRKLHRAEERLRLAQPQGGLLRHPTLPPGASISLESVLGLSYTADTLDERARQALQALAVFPAKPSTFSEAAALTIAATTAEILDRLVDASLVEVSEQGRYTLHQTIVDFARAKGGERAASERMARYFTDYAAQHQKDYNMLELETGSILNALESAYDLNLQAPLVQGAIAFADFLVVRGMYEVAERHLNLARQAATALDDTLSVATILLNLGKLVARRGDYRQALDYVREGIILARAQDVPALTCALLAEIGEVWNHIGAYQQAEGALQEALTLARQLEDKERLCFILKNLGVVASEGLGDYAQAEAYLQEGLTLARVLDAPLRLIGLLQSLGVVAAYRGNYEAAEHYLQESLTLARQIEGRASISTQLLNLGALADLRGNPEQANQYWQESLTLARQIGLQENIVYLLLNLGEAALHREDYQQAEAYLQEGIMLARQMNHTRVLCTLLRDSGELALQRGAIQQAAAYLQEGLGLARQMQHAQEMSATLCAWGDLLLKQGDLDRATATFSEALETAPEESQEGRATALYGLAQVTVAQGKRDEAVRLGQEAVEVFEKLGHRKGAEARQWLERIEGSSA